MPAARSDFRNESSFHGSGILTSKATVSGSCIKFAASLGFHSLFYFAFGHGCHPFHLARFTLRVSPCAFHLARFTLRVSPCAFHLARFVLPVPAPFVGVRRRSV